MALRSLTTLVALLFCLLIESKDRRTSAKPAPIEFEGCEFTAPLDKKCENAIACAKSLCKQIAADRKDEKLLKGIDADFRQIASVFKDEQSIREWFKDVQAVREPSDVDLTQFLVALWTKWKIEKTLEPKGFAVGLNDFTLVKFESVPSGAAVFINGTRRGVTPTNVFISTKDKTKYRVELKGYVTRESEDFLATQGAVVKVILAESK